MSRCSLFVTAQNARLSYPRSIPIVSVRTFDGIVADRFLFMGDSFDEVASRERIDFFVWFVDHAIKQWIVRFFLEIPW